MPLVWGYFNPKIVAGFAEYSCDVALGSVVARYYDPTIGRFISADSIVPNPANPQTLNRYSYCLNNPLARIDPTGHWPPFVDAAISWLDDNVVDLGQETLGDCGNAFRGLGRTLFGDPRSMCSSDPMDRMTGGRASASRYTVGSTWRIAFPQEIEDYLAYAYTEGDGGDRAKATALAFGCIALEYAGGWIAGKAGGWVISKFGCRVVTRIVNKQINITEKGLQHVIERHTINDIAKFAGKSKFNVGEDLVELIQKAAEQPMVKQINGNYERIFNVGRNIGIDTTTGQQTSIMTVITDKSGNLITAFPGRPMP